MPPATANVAAAAAAALLPVAAGCLALVVSAADVRAQGACDESAGFAVLSSPAAPWTGAPLRVVVTVEQSFDGELSLIAPNGSVAARSRHRHGGPPYFWFAEVASPAAGTWRSGQRILLARAGRSRDVDGLE